MNSIIEMEERNEGVFIAVLNFLCSLLEARKHRTLAAGEVLTSITMLANFAEDLLHDDKLIRYKRVVVRKLLRAIISLNIQYRISKAEKITKNRIVFVIKLNEFRRYFGFFFRIRFWITSSTEEEVKDKRVLKRA